MGDIIGVTGCGMPDRGTTSFVKSLLDQSELTSYIYVDPDPEGFLIALQYLYGYNELKGKTMFDFYYEEHDNFKQKLLPIWNPEQIEEIPFTSKQFRKIRNLESLLHDKVDFIFQDLKGVWMDFFRFIQQAKGFTQIDKIDECVILQQMRKITETLYD